MSEPVVSVIVPTFNRIHFLSEAIDSICAQTMRDFELIVVDDASTDGTQEAVTARAAKDERIKFLPLETNAGCGNARNVGLDHAKGRYIAFLDDDDLAQPNRLEASVRRFQADPDLDVLATAYHFIDMNGCKREWKNIRNDFGPQRTGGDIAFEKLYCDWAWLPTSTLMMRAGVMADVRFPVFRRPDEDSTLWMQLAATGATFAQLTEPLAFLRRDDAYESLSRDRLNLLAARRETLKLMPSWLTEHGIGAYNHLHQQAWSKHLMKEANEFGRARGLSLAIRAWLSHPQNELVKDYFRLRSKWILRRLNMKRPTN